MSLNFRKTLTFRGCIHLEAKGMAGEYIIYSHASGHHDAAYFPLARPVVWIHRDYSEVTTRARAEALCNEHEDAIMRHI